MKRFVCNRVFTVSFSVNVSAQTTNDHSVECQSSSSDILQRDF